MNDKFLNVCFSIGKGLFSFLLVITLLVSLGLLVNTGIKCVKISSAKVEYKYDVNNAFHNLYSGILDTTETTSNDISQNNNDDDTLSPQKKKAVEILYNFYKEQKLSEKLIYDFKFPVDENEIVPYTNNFVAYYNDFIKQLAVGLAKKQGISETNVKTIIDNNKTEVYQDALNSYAEEYQNESAQVDSEKQNFVNERNMSLIAFAVSLLIFVLFLILPILIRIEENTRKK